MLTRLRQDHPEIDVSAVNFAADAMAPVGLTARRDTIYADAYTGALVGESTEGMRRFMSATRAWHRWIAIEGEGRPFARAMTGWSNAISLFIVASGFYLWFPRKWSWQHMRGARGSGLGARDSGVVGENSDLVTPRASANRSTFPL